jgi:hypothetical protein
MIKYLPRATHFIVGQPRLITANVACPVACCDDTAVNRISVEMLESDIKTELDLPETLVHP